MYRSSFFVIVILFLFTSADLRAQQHHFLYIQSEQKDPFYVVLKEKVYSSSETGYLIIPKLTNGEYNFTLGFPLNKFPEQAFNYNANNQDAGYLLKKFGDKGWGLVDMQTQDVLMSGATSAIAVNTNSAFGNMLSEVIDDSDLVKKNVIAPEPVAVSTADSFLTTMNNPPDTIQYEEKKAEIITINNSNNIPATTVKNAPEKLSESLTDEGYKMIFIDKNDNTADTVQVIIPSDIAGKNTVINDNSNVINKSIPNDEDANTEDVTKVNTDKKETSNPFYKKEETAPQVNAEQDNTTEQVGVSGTRRENCESILSDDDLNKMKRKMFSQNSNEKMINVAEKYISGKCLNTEQVKNLGVLFLSDEGRYNLYDAMYKHVYDYGNYSSLQSQIIDPYYKKRFLALTQ